MTAQGRVSPGRRLLVGYTLCPFIPAVAEYIARYRREHHLLRIVSVIDMGMGMGMDMGIGMGMGMVIGEAQFVFHPAEHGKQV